MTDFITLPHGQPHAKMANNSFVHDKPIREMHQIDSGKPEQKSRACYLLL